MKQILKLSLLLLALLLPATAHAHDFEVDGIYYKINGTEATVTYRGTDYSQYNNEYSGSVTIPETVTYNSTTYSVTAIGYYAFYNCSWLTSVTIPNSVTTIGNSAFSGCNGLTSVTIPNSVTTIGYYAFDETAWYNNQPNGLVYAGLVAYQFKGTMPANTHITLREGTLGIAGCAFFHCTGLSSVTIPNSVTEIGSSAFEGCSGLTSVTIPNSVTSLGEYAFLGCSGLTSATIGNSVTTIGFAAFRGCTGLTSITIPNSVTSLGEYAFYECTGLTSITIPSSVTTIDGYAFSGCSGLTSITIPNSVTTIDEWAFYGCSRLTSVTIPNSVTTIGDYAFYNCSGLTSIDIGNSVTTIGNSAFSNCSGLTSVTIPNSVTTIGEWAFSNCSGLTSIDIGNSVTTIGNSAFYNCTGLTSITIPNSVTTIGEQAFNGCSGLTSIDIPNSVTFVGKQAFDNCPAIETVTCKATTPPASNGNNLFTTNVYIHTPLYVPIGSERAYMADLSWGQFINIIGVGMEDEVLATGISLNKPVAYLLVGGSSQLVATVRPDSTTNKTVTWASNNPSIASVDNNGLVTALAPGNATITAMTTDGSNLSASCLVVVSEDMSDYDDYLSLDNASAFRGDTIVIPVKMTNASSITAFQTDIFLPECLELLKEDGEYLIDPSERMTRSHSIMSNDVSNGAVRVICYSSNYKPFTGNSGDDLFYITVKVADDAEGDYIIQLKNTLLTNTDFIDIVAPDVDATINVKAYILGDANISGIVTITDVVVTAQYVLERDPQPFNFDAADVNKDSYITIADVARIAWMVLNPDEANAPLRAPALWNNGDRMSGEGVSLMAGETRTVSIALDNEMDYTAFQMDLTMPEGLTASNFRLTDRAGSHAFDINTLANGKTRVLCYSPAIEVIDGHDGALLTFDVTAAGNMNGDIAVDGIELVTADCQTVHPDAFTIGVNAATSINEIAGSKTVARVDYFNVAGQRIDQPKGGVILVVTTYTDGTRTTTKLMK